MSDFKGQSFTALNDLWVCQSYAPLLLAHGLASLEALMSLTKCSRLDKPGLPDWRERLRLELTGADGEIVTLYLKRYRPPPMLGLRERLLHGSVSHGMAWIEWYWMRRLAADGLATMTPVAFGESMSRWRERCSAVLTAEVAGESLERWAKKQTGRCPRSLPASLGRFVSELHEKGYVHRDLYLSHVFVNGSTDLERRFHLIDLQRVMRPTRWTRRWLVKDLAALNYSTPAPLVTLTDRLRFLRRYLSVRRLGSAEKRFARRIAAKTRRIAEHDRRRSAQFAESASADRGADR